MSRSAHPRGHVLRLEWLEDRRLLYAPTDVTLRVDAVTGEAVILFNAAVNLSAYEIDSYGEFLAPSQWVDFSHQSPAYPGWAVWSSMASRLMELRNSGSTGFAAGQQVSLGNVFLAGNPRDLTFSWQSGFDLYQPAVSYVDPATNPTTTTLTSSASSSTYGQSVSFTATVNSAAGTPSGLVGFYCGSGDQFLGMASLDAGGVAQYTTSAIPKGSHQIVARYAGDGVFQASAGQVSHAVTMASTSTVLTSDLNPSTYGQLVTFTATVSSSGGTPAGSVVFYDGGARVGEVNLDASGTAALSTSALARGAHVITARYWSSAPYNYTTSTSNTVHQTVNAATASPTTTALTSSANPWAYGETLTLTATVSATAGTPTGMVSFVDQGVVIGVAALDGSGRAVFTTSSLSVGAHNIIAAYQGDAACAASFSAVLVQTVDPAIGARAVTLSIDLLTGAGVVTFNNNVNLSGYEITSASGSLDPTKWVDLSHQTPPYSGWGVLHADAYLLAEGNLGGATAFSLGQSVSLGNVFRPGGLYDLQFSWLDGNSQVWYPTVTYVNAAPNVTAAALTSSLNPAPYGQAITFTATVISPGGAPDGTVYFFAGQALLGTATLDAAGVATYTTTTLAGGTHSLSAVYAGNATFQPSSAAPFSQIVTKLTTTTALTSATNPSTYGESVTFTATVSAPGITPTGTVNFYDGATVVSTKSLSGGTATYTTSTLSAGTRSIKATYFGNASFTMSTSSTLSQVVNKAATATVLTSAANPSTYLQSVTFTATVTSPVGTPTGTVRFYDGATLLGSKTLSGGTATYTTTTLATGAHAITATYVASTNYLASTSAAVAQVVNPAATTTTVTSALNPSVYGQSVTFTATVTSPGATPTGTVRFYDGETLLSSKTLSSGKATYATTTLAAATHAITASYVGSTNYLASTSAALSQVVNAQGLVSISVQQGQKQRSYVRYVDLTFADATGLSSLVSEGRVRLTRFELNGSGGSDVSLAGVLAAVGNKIGFDFGAGGIGGNPNSTAGDGYYEIKLDLDGNGSNETLRHFYRLLGDVRADRSVNLGDFGLLKAYWGTTNAAGDANGDGRVDAADYAAYQLAYGRALAAALALDA